MPADANTSTFLPHPLVGDRFTYNGTFWVHVIALLGPYIVVEEYELPCVLPDNARVRIFRSAQHFRESYQVPGTENFWIRYFDHDAPLRHIQPSAAEPDEPTVARAKPVLVSPEAGTPKDALLELVAEHSLQATAANGGLVALSEREYLVCRAARGTTVPQPGTCINDESGVLERALFEDRVLQCHDTYRGGGLTLDAFRRAGIRSVLIVPLRSAAGIIAVFSREPRAFCERDVKTLCLTSEMLSHMLEQGNVVPDSHVLTEAGALPVSA
ncbi:MAG: GAF domain-containing protein [Acidobacteria bacterium]|nr:GAF domain-containing protein [Acidobacteriaceae bacterium]MBV9608512.1 GAF domain-containing protein [Acidobacteriota bacterium]